MGLLQEIIKKMNGSEEEPREEIPDNVTRDNHLRSLRREDRVMDEEEEKKHLIKKIAERRKHKLRTELFGIKEKIRQKKEGKTGFLGKHNL